MTEPTDIKEVENSELLGFSIDELKNKIYFLENKGTKILVWEQVPRPTDTIIKIMLKEFKDKAKKVSELYAFIDITRRLTKGSTEQRNKLATFANDIPHLKHSCIIVGHDRSEYEIYARMVLNKGKYPELKYSIHTTIEDALDTVNKIYKKK